MSNRHLLLIEDDDAIRCAVSDALAAEGFSSVAAATGEEGLRHAGDGMFDLVLLDLVLPGIDGFAVLESLRELQPALPVIILSARGEESQRIRGLQLGADDYVVKPFSVGELLARIESVLRRCRQQGDAPRRFKLPGGIEVNLSQRLVRFPEGRETELSQRESDLLCFLHRHRGRTVARDTIMTHVWNLNPRGMKTRTIDVHIGRLREKLGDLEGTWIRTIRGEGYVLNEEDGNG